MITKNPMQLKAFIKNKAAEKHISAQLVMQNYMLERLLERISLSPYAGCVECDTILANHDCRITKMCKQLLSHNLISVTISEVVARSSPEAAA